MSKFWVLLAFLLAAGHLGKDDYTDQLIIEAKKQEIARCQRIQEEHAKALTTLLDRGGILYVAGDPVTLCRRNS